MTPEAKRTILATVLCMLILLGWIKLQAWLYPPPPPGSDVAAGPVATQPAGAPGAAQSGSAPAVTASGGPPAGPSATPPSPTGYAAVGGPSGETLSIGIDAPRKAGDVANPYLLGLRLNPRGASLEAAERTDHRNNVATSRQPPADTYDLLAPLRDPFSDAVHWSMTTKRILFVADRADVDLASVAWTAAAHDDQKGQTARFETTIMRGGAPALKLAKTYRIEHDSAVIRMELELSNLSDEPLDLVLQQGGPLGMRLESLNYDDRHAYVALHKQSVKPHHRGEVWGKEGHELDITARDEGRVLPVRWAATANRYFSCIMIPVSAQPDAPPDFVRKITLRTLFEIDQSDLGDLTLDFFLAPPHPLAAGASRTFAFDIYAGPRSPQSLPTGPVYADLQLDRLYSADRSPCTFEWLAQLMIRLFNLLHAWLPGKHNFAVAIIVLVLIVRTLLHPLTKKAQINMARTQKAMATLQPKMEELKKKFANDKAALNQAMIELYREEGYNPVGFALNCLPMLMQMPVWVALWSTLNTAIELRHEPMIPGLPWIRDLSSPDSLFSLGFSFRLPLIGSITGPISAFNLLPFVMALTMYLQQKYQQKLTRPDNPPPPSTPTPDGRPSAAEQLAMQQKMKNFMVVFMSIMFYNFPSGLNLYILTSNIFGMIEQKRIRDHIKREEARGALLPPRRVDTPADAPNWLKRLQKMAEEARQVRRDDR